MDDSAPPPDRPDRHAPERPESRRPARRTPRPLARVLGIPLYTTPSMLLLALLVTVLYGEFARRELDLSQPAAYAVGLGFVVCLLGSVMLHELGHALLARRYGVGVRGITLELLGGYTEMDRDAPTPKVDLLVSLAGPAVSLLLGGLAAGAAWLLPDGGLADSFAAQLAVGNGVVALFNVLPGLPLDGGRALRAVVWAACHDRHRATEVAGWAGRVIAAGAGIAVVVLGIRGVFTLVGAVFLLLVSFTVLRGAGQSVRLARMSRRFPLVDLASLATPVLPVPSGTPLAEAQRRHAEADARREEQAQAWRTGVEEPPAGVVTGAGTTLGVADSSGRLLALVDRVAADEVPAERRAWVSVDTVARDLARIPVLPAGLTGEQVVRAVQAHPGAQYLVTAGEDVLGVLHVADLARILEPRRTARDRGPSRAGTAS